MRVYLELGRVSNLPTVWTNVAAGAVLAGGAADARHLLPVVVALSAFYAGGMYLNDAFDAGIDRRERPERPIPSGRITVQRVLAIGFALVAGGLVMLLAAGALGSGRLSVGLSGLALAGAIVLYDLWHKGNRLSPLLMATCRSLVYVNAALATGGHLGPALWVGAVLLFVYVALLTRLAKLGPRFPVGTGTLVAGISVVDGLLVLLCGRLDLALLCLMSPLLTRRLQRKVSGT